MSIHFSATLSAESAHVKLTYISVDNEEMRSAEKTATVRRAIMNNMIRPARLEAVN